MSLEHELVSLDPTKLNQIMDVLWSQARASADPDELLPTDLGEKYTILHGMVDEMGERLFEDVEANEMDEDLAVAMTFGARLACMCLISYSEAVGFDMTFMQGEPQDD